MRSYYLYWVWEIGIHVLYMWSCFHIETSPSKLLWLTTTNGTSMQDSHVVVFLSRMNYIKPFLFRCERMIQNANAYSYFLIRVLHVHDWTTYIKHQPPDFLMAVRWLGQAFHHQLSSTLWLHMGKYGGTWLELNLPFLYKLKCDSGWHSAKINACL